jgi:hypothetical protein
MSTEKLLKDLGLSDDLAASLTDEQIDEAKGQIISSIKSKLLEDEEFYKGIDKSRLPREFFAEKFNEGISKISATSKAAIDKHFGLTEADKADFSEDERKDVSRYIAKATELYKGKTSSSKDLTTLQDENLALKQQLEAKDTEMRSVQEKFDSDFKEKLTSKETEWLAKSEALSLQNNIPVPVSLVFDKVFDVIKSKYSVIIEDGQANIRKKENPSFKVPKKDSNKEYMTLKDAIIEELKSNSAWSESTSKNDNKTNVTVQVQPNRGILNDAIKKKIAEEEAFFGQ